MACAGKPGRTASILGADFLAASRPGGVYAMRALGHDHLHKFGVTAVRYYILPASIGSAETFSPERLSFGCHGAGAPPISRALQNMVNTNAWQSQTRER